MKKYLLILILFCGCHNKMEEIHNNDSLKKELANKQSQYIRMVYKNGYQQGVNSTLIAMMTQIGKDHFDKEYVSKLLDNSFKLDSLNYEPLILADN